MEKGRLDNLVKEGLVKASEDIKMSPGLKDRIIGSTINKKKNLLRRFLDLLDTTIEISVPSAAIACVVLIIFVFSGFTWMWGSRNDKSLEGYTSIKVVKMGGSDIIIDINSKEVALYGVEDKN